MLTHCLSAEAGLVVALATLTCTCASRLLFGALIELRPSAHVVRVSLLTCDSACRCAPACVHMNYTNGRLYCELVKRNLTGRSLYFEGRLDYLNADDVDLLITDGVSEPTDTVCSVLGQSLCPDLVAINGTIVLDHLNTITGQQPVQLSWMTGQGGWDRASCSAFAECSDTRVTQSTMREACHLDSECVDAESECRDGHCWCKPGLSHDPDTMACVALCPGQYGPTFQIVRNAYITLDINIEEVYYQDIGFLTCLDKCASYGGPKICKSAHYTAYNELCSIDLYKSTDRMVSDITLSDAYGNMIVLQRDCLNMSG